MSKVDDEFDYSDIAPQVIVRATPPRLAKRKDKFIRVPLWMSDRLTKERSPVSAWAVLHFLLFESWKTEKDTIKFANGFAGTLGISPDSKVRGLRELERLGMVRVEWRDKRSPIVTVLAEAG